MKRAEIFVDGDVQGVGYRYYVRRAARKHRLAGSVENLEDGRVKIICEGEEKEIKEFLENVNIKELPIFVESMDYTFSEPTGEFKIFKVVTGKLEEEMVEGFSTGMAYLQSIREDVRGVGDGVRKVGEDVRSVGDEVRKVGEDVRSVGDEVRKVGEDVRSVREEVSLTREELRDEIKGLRFDLKSYLDERFAKLEKEMERVKEKIGIL